MYVDLEELAGTRRNSQELAQSAPHSSCYSLFSSYKSAFDRYRYALSRILSSFINTTSKMSIKTQTSHHQRDNWRNSRDKHPTTKETIDEIPETTFTLASIAATAASSRYHRHRFDYNGHDWFQRDIEYIRYRKQSPNYLPSIQRE